MSLVESVYILVDTCSCRILVGSLKSFCFDSLNAFHVDSLQSIAKVVHRFRLFVVNRILNFRSMRGLFPVLATHVIIEFVSFFCNELLATLFLLNHVFNHCKTVL
jgi:hypothetical protein